MANVPSYRAADRHLDEALAASLIGEQFPALAQLGVRRLGEGWDNEVYAVGDDWLFRFPKRADTVQWLEREDVILRLVAGRIGVQVPRFELRGRPNSAFPYPFVGYRRVRGVSADAVVGDRSGLAADLGRAFTALHSLDPSLVPPTPAGWETEDPEAELREVVEDARWIRPLLPPEIAEVAEPYLRGEVPRPPFTGPPRFKHNDIFPHHVLVDRNGRLAGIIDFADAMAGDPVGDFVGLVCLGGYAFVREILDHYDMPVDEGFEARLHWTSHVLHLHWLAEADDTDDPDDVAKHLGWVRRAFEDLLS